MLNGSVKVPPPPPGDPDRCPGHKERTGYVKPMACDDTDRQSKVPSLESADGEDCRYSEVYLHKPTVIKHLVLFRTQ